MAVSGCSGCGEQFGTLESFDAHQHWDRAGEWKLSCAVPPGLVADARGTWQTPEGLAARGRAGERFAQMASERGGGGLGAHGKASPA